MSAVHYEIECHLMTLLVHDNKDIYVVVIEGIMKAVYCVKMIVDHLHLFLLDVFLDGTGIFQQDYCPSRKVIIMLQWFEEYDSELMLKSFPPNFAYLNMKEHTSTLFGTSTMPIA